MTLVGLSMWWYVGWVLGLVVVAVAASLLIVAIALGRRIVGQANDITRALEGTQRHTDPLWEVRRTNHELDRVTRGLAGAREQLS
jgi:hypothetical protein